MTQKSWFLTPQTIIHILRQIVTSSLSNVRVTHPILEHVTLHPQAIIPIFRKVKLKSLTLGIRRVHNGAVEVIHHIKLLIKMMKKRKSKKSITGKEGSTPLQIQRFN